MSANLVQKLKITSTAFLILASLPVSAKTLKRFILRHADISRVQALMDRQSKHITIDRELDEGQGVVVTLTKKGYSLVKRELPEVQVEEDKRIQLINSQMTVSTTASLSEAASAAKIPQQVPWGVAAVGATQAQQYTKGKGITVCVIDTGIQTTHPDLKGQVIGGRNFVAGADGKIKPKKFQDDNGHGTHVAGTIAALDNKIGVVGIAPKAKLLSLKVLDSQGSGFISDLADAIRYCAKSKARIASMSIGTLVDSPLLREAVYEASRAGLIMVAASGNMGGIVDFPAAYPEVLAVSAVDEELKFADFSNRGPEIDYTAPGVNILSTTIFNSYAYYSGTSMATPHVAGVIALALSAKKTQLATQDLGLSPDEQGLGLVDALKTVTTH